MTVYIWADETTVAMRLHHRNWTEVMDRIELAGDQFPVFVHVDRAIRPEARTAISIDITVGE
jgi:hypothetical protein